MIVKNEANTIMPLLESVYQYIDYAVIVDTGSEDETINVLKKFFKLHNIDHEIHERAWVDFATNRNQALELAHGKAEYVLCLDADWTLVVESQNVFDDLQADCYLYQIEHDGITYYNERLLKDGLDWKWVHAIHEQPESPIATTFVQLVGAYLKVRSVGGKKTNRYLQDVEILTKSLALDPEDEHALFYLGNSYFTLKQYSKAHEAYHRLIGLTARTTKQRLRKERQYFALRRLSDMTDDIREKIDYLVRAQDLMPFRAEALYPLLVFLREQGDLKRAYALCDSFAQSPAPTQGIAVQKNLYEWAILSEQVVLEGSLGYLQEAYASCKGLLNIASLPDDHRISAEQNLVLISQALS